MRDDTRRRIERAIWMQRLKWVGGALVLALVMAGGFWLEGRDATVETRKVAGVVEYVGPLTGKVRASTASAAVSVDVRLGDGRTARLMVPKTSEPHTGDHVEIKELIHGTGRHSFAWQ